MIETTLTIKMTTTENASKSWEDRTEQMIEKYPYHATLTGLGGGYFKTIPTIAEINSGFAKSHPDIKYPLDYSPNKLGQWGIKMYKKNELKSL